MSTQDVKLTLDTQRERARLSSRTSSYITHLEENAHSPVRSIVNNHMAGKIRRNPKVAILVAFCRYNDNLSAVDVFASFARQLADSERNELVFPDIQYFHKIRSAQFHDSKEFTLPNLLALLQHLFEKFTKVYISIDALDEVSDEVKVEVLSGLASLKANKFITSRPLKSYESLLPRVHSLELESSLLSDGDIQHFILRSIDMTPRLRSICAGNVDVRKKVCEILKQKSAGMYVNVWAPIKRRIEAYPTSISRFLICALQIEVIKRITTLKKLLDALESLPSGVEGMYHCTWGRILAQTPEEAQLARKAIAWLSFGKRSFKTIELRQALGVSTETWTYDADDIPDQDVLLGVCCGLVTVDEANRTIRLVRELVFIHQGFNFLTWVATLKTTQPTNSSRRWVPSSTPNSIPS